MKRLHARQPDTLKNRMKFDTAVFYDIENLIGGYGARSDYISELSLKEIHEEIKGIAIVGGIAIQRAYANWSNSRLNVMRGDIVDLGIDPIQMFGFGKGTSKNASDIQLAVDAVDIAITRESIRTFVIVSGDGGFSALAKKLHEHGKAVVGCAYRQATNRVFESVCDHFVWIDQPVAAEPVRTESAAGEATPPLLREFAAGAPTAEAKTQEEMLSKARAALDRLFSLKDSQYLLRSTGMNISMVSQALSLSIKGFSFVKCGFPKQIDFLRHVLHGGRVSLVHRQPSEYRIVNAGNRVAGFVAVETNPERPSLHTESAYRTILASDPPMFRIPSQDVVATVAGYLAGNADGIRSLPLGDIIESVAEACDIEQKDAKESVLAFVSAGLFDRKPEDKRISEQNLTIKAASLEDMMGTLRESARSKLLSSIGEIDEAVFAKILD